MWFIDETKYEPINDRVEFSSPKITIGIIVSYLIFVYQIGPKFMQNRPAYKLNNFMSVYNIFQVVSCLYIIKHIWNITSSTILDVTKCVYFLPDTPERAAYDDISYKIYLLKIIELLDTIIFVLRKKQNQITYLHVFHHSSTITLCYMILKYSRVTGALFPVFLNSIVHVFMYTYYFFANVCSAETMKKFIILKKSITIIQMVQFCIILAHASILWTICKLPPMIKYYYIVVICVIFYGFYDFYKKAYLSNQEKKAKITTK